MQCVVVTALTFACSCSPSSGYSNDPVMANYQQYEFKASIGKPFKMTQLKEIINAIMG
jgi:hypothetical protein